MSTIPPATRSRFLAKVDIPDDPDACWLWRGSMLLTGYGVLSIGGRGGQMIRAHRLAYELFVGPIPDGLHILHACDVRRCVNPRHLRPGTRAENMAEAVERKRMASGDRNGMRVHPERHWLRADPTRATRGEAAHQSTLTETDVRTIRREHANGARQTALARRYGISQAAISKIVRRETWSHVTDT